MSRSADRMNRPAVSRVSRAACSGASTLPSTLSGSLIRRIFAASRAGIRGPFKVDSRKSTRLNSSHTVISYAVFCLKKKKTNEAEELYDLSGGENDRSFELGV